MTIKKVVYTTEKLGTDPTRKEYGPHIFARVNFVDHVFWHGMGTRVLFGFMAPKTKKNGSVPVSSFSYVSVLSN